MDLQDAERKRGVAVLSRLNSEVRNTLHRRMVWAEQANTLAKTCLACEDANPSRTGPSVRTAAPGSRHIVPAGERT